MAAWLGSRRPEVSGARPKRIEFMTGGRGERKKTGLRKLGARGAAGRKAIGHAASDEIGEGLGISWLPSLRRKKHHKVFTSGESGEER